MGRKFERGDEFESYSRKGGRYQEFKVVKAIDNHRCSDKSCKNSINPGDNYARGKWDNTKLHLDCVKDVL